jgi:hypothetical protein
LTKKGDETQGWEKFQERATLSAILWAFQGGNYSRGIRDAWHPSKTQVGSGYNHKAPEIGQKKQKPVKTKHFSFLTHSH